MRASEFEHKQVNEVAPVKSIAGWFKGLIDKDVKARKAGEAEIKNFTNQHMTAFMKQMGRYGKDWPNLTMRVLYQYLQTGMKLRNDDIVHVVNMITGKNLSLRDIQDPDNNIRVFSINPRAQETAEKIIAAGSLRQLERHWETQAGVTEPMKYGQDKKDTAQQPAAQEEPAVSTAQPETQPLIKTGTIKKASDGKEYVLNVNPVNAVWLRTDGSGEANSKVANELDKKIGRASCRERV